MAGTGDGNQSTTGQAFSRLDSGIGRHYDRASTGNVVREWVFSGTASLQADLTGHR